CNARPDHTSGVKSGCEQPQQTNSAGFVSYIGRSSIQPHLYPASITVTLTAASEMVAGGRTARPRTMSDALSAIMMTGALMLPPTRSGITEASTTRKASVPNTFSLVSTTAVGSLATPILHVPSG